MSARKLDDSLGNLGRAVANLERALTIPTDGELVFEGTIWKTLKRALEFEGLSPKTPRDSVKEAFRIGWLHDEAVWLDMLDHRNTTSHAYLSDELVAANYRDIAKVTPLIRTTFDFLAQRYRTI